MEWNGMEGAEEGDENSIYRRVFRTSNDALGPLGEAGELRGRGMGHIRSSREALEPPADASERP
eukprot:7733501-Pyramimonas_sp.AAC.1